MGWIRGRARDPYNQKESVTIRGHLGRVVEKRIRCGGSEQGRPRYRKYKYLVIREGKKVKTIYLGKV